MELKVAVGPGDSRSSGFVAQLGQQRRQRADGAVSPVGLDPGATCSKQVDPFRSPNSAQALRVGPHPAARGGSASRCRGQQMKALFRRTVVFLNKGFMHLGDHQDLECTAGKIRAALVIRQSVCNDP